MKLLDSMVSTFDVLTRRASSAEELQQRAKEFRAEAQLRGNAVNRSVAEAYDSIDTKSTAILQHVSIMIAVSGVLYTQASKPLFQYLFIAEMLLYVILALFCLRLLMAQHVSSAYDDVQNVAAKEAFVDLTAKLTFLISVGLVLTVIFEVAGK